MKLTRNNHQPPTDCILEVKGQGHTLCQVCGGKGSFSSSGVELSREQSQTGFQPFSIHHLLPHSLRCYVFLQRVLCSFL